MIPQTTLSTVCHQEWDIEQLVQIGAVEKVKYSDWVAPQNLWRLQGDYINPQPKNESDT